MVRHRTSKLGGLKERHYTARLIDLKKYLALLPGATFSDKIGVSGLNEILFNSMLNSWNKQAYVQGFDCEYIYFKNQLTCFDACILLNRFMKV